MITMQDIATKLGVSRATVSYSLGDRWSVEEMGRQAGVFLLDRIENKVDTRRTIQISGRLLEGNSTIAIPSGGSS